MTAARGRWWTSRWLRLTAAIAVTAGIVGTVGWFWFDSRVPSTYSVMDMGYLDYGGGPATGHVHPGGTSVADLTGSRDDAADVAVTLTARQEEFALGSGEQVTGYTLNHTSPGPTIQVTEGELLEVTLVNESVPDGATLHWHGVDVPNAEDGVAGVTQDAVPVGGQYVYRFRAEDPGSYWYHSHQVSHEQVRRGLFGALVIAPRDAEPEREELAVVHTYDGRRTISGHTGVRRVEAAAGEQVRVRVVNTDNGSLRVSLSGAPYRVAALDARDIHEPTEVTDQAVLLAAGGRADLVLTVPAGGGAARVDIGAGAALVLGPAEAPEPPAAEHDPTVDLLSYGSPAPLGFDPAAPDRRFELRIGRRPGFLDGRPGLWWTMNGKLFPEVPMYVVREGDVAIMTISNSSGDVHPMHLHGHHVVVLSRNGEPATGSPWRTDSLDVDDGESYEVAFQADNPGVWMDHCHNLPHAVEGMITHLMYEGVTTPYLVGGEPDNQPE
ncbi:MAG: multicopper oxidase domain-containing protein [Micromonosporaceae bacterium]|nr:multicopper oxidase domain-containing protein [Micromonosporaceae bacterium]